jgi:hypothetical protein
MTITSMLGAGSKAAGSACAVAVVLLIAGPAAAQSVEIIGVLNTIYGDIDPELGQEHPTAPEYLLVDDNGAFFSLDLDPELTLPFGGPHALNRTRVIVIGDPDPDTGRIHVTEIRPVIILEEEPPGNSHHLGSHASGSQKWVTLLCRFGDATGVTPEPVTFFDDLMALMDVYWQELSYGAIDLAGSQVVDWVNLPQARAGYLDDPTTHFAGHTANLGELAVECATAADTAVNFPDFDGINFIFNQNLDCCSWGGSVTLNLDGMMKTYSSTWMATWGWGNQDVMGQEMGHGFGLPHSSGPYAATYDSNWDVQSGGGICSPADPDFGCLGVHTVGFHKDALGWIAGPDKVDYTGPGELAVTLERLALPVGGNPLLANVPIGGSADHFYTVECRQPFGFDDQIPGAAVLIHEVDTMLADRNAQVVDVDAVPDTDPNDTGAMWLPGEVFEDAPNSIRIAVVGQTDQTCDVLINPDNLGPTADAGPDQVLECTSPAGALAMLDGTGSSDPDMDALSFEWSAPGVVFDDATSATPSGTFPLDTTTATLTVTDPGMESDSDDVSITVQDTTPPLLVCPPDIEIECNADGGVFVSDPQIQGFLAGAMASDFCDPAVPVSNDAPAMFGLGTTPVTFTGVDDDGNVGQCQANVTVVDTTPPELSASADPESLWPPNHRLVSVGVDATATDTCDPSPSVVLIAASSNESDDGRGDGRTTGDIQSASIGTADFSVQLRAERAGRGTGRVYTLTYEAEDASGNTATDSAEVAVAHDRR